MAAYSVTLPAFFNTDGDFRQWGSEISARLGSGGLVKTADTGQIDWTTVPKPVVNNTFAGYEIWRFDDALQATVPIFIRIRYGVAGAVNRPQITISIASGTDGAGNLTGPVTTAQNTGANASKTAGATLPSFMSVSTDRLVMVLNYDSADTNFGFGLAVERAKDSSGVNTSDGAVHMTFGALGVNTTQQLPRFGPVPSSQGSTAGVFPNVAYTGHGSDSILLLPVVAFGEPRWLSSLAIVDDAAVTLGASFTAAPFGASLTFLPLALASAFRPTAGTGTLRTAIRFD